MNLSWRSLRNNWLHVNTLDTAAAVRQLVSFYVDQHNHHLPHSAFPDETPDEIVLRGRRSHRGLPRRQRADAQHQRLITNRALTCTDCSAAPADQMPDSGRVDSPTALPRDGPKAV